MEAGRSRRAIRTKHKRRYQPDTLVLETDQITDDGAIRITDFMPIRDEASVVVRSVSGLAGRVRICSELNLQFDYGSVSPWIEIEGRTAIARVGPDFVSFQSPVDIDLHGGTMVSEAEVREGDELHFVLSYQSNPHHRKLHLDPHKLLDATQRHWRDWIGRFERPDRLAGRSATVSDHAESAHLPTFGWNCCRSDHVTSRGSERRDELGLSLLLAA